MTLEENILHRDSSEKAILGAISVDNSQIDEVSQILKPHMFQSGNHKAIYEAMLTLREDGTDINDSTIFIYYREMKFLNIYWTKIRSRRIQSIIVIC